MRARDHTQAMLRFYHQHHITTVDLALRRIEGTFIWHDEQPLDHLPMAWLRAENVRHSEGYIRPARHLLISTVKEPPISGVMEPLFSAQNGSQTRL